VGPAKRIDVAQPALEIDGLLDLADVDDLRLRDVEVRLAWVADEHVRLRRQEDGLGGLGRPVEDLPHRAELAVPRLDGIAEVDFPLDYRHGGSPKTMEPRVL